MKSSSFSIIALALALTANIVSAKTITFKTDYWCPYACFPNSKNPGYVIEIITEIYAKSGHQVNYEVLNWSRVLEETKNGQIDGAIGGGSSEFSKFIIHKEPIGVNSNYFWTKTKSKFNYKNIDSVKSAPKDSIGIINDYSYGEEIDPLIKNSVPSFHVVSGDKSLDTLLRLLIKDRITAIIENENVVLYNLKNFKLNLNDYKTVGQNLNRDPGLFIGFSPNKSTSRKYAKMLDDGIIEMRNSGRLKIILDKYGIKDWK